MNVFLHNFDRINWQWWKQNEIIYFKLIQMIKNVFFCSISSIKIKRVFNVIKKMCFWNRKQLNSKIVEHDMMIKYYNRIMNLNYVKILIESWNFFRREKKMTKIFYTTFLTIHLKKMCKKWYEKFMNKKMFISIEYEILIIFKIEINKIMRMKNLKFYVTLTSKINAIK